MCAALYYHEEDPGFNSWLAALGPSRAFAFSHWFPFFFFPQSKCMHVRRLGDAKLIPRCESLSCVSVFICVCLLCDRLVTCPLCLSAILLSAPWLLRQAPAPQPCLRIMKGWNVLSWRKVMDFLVLNHWNFGDICIAENETDGNAENTKCICQTKWFAKKGSTHFTFLALSLSTLINNVNSTVGL